MSLLGRLGMELSRFFRCSEYFKCHSPIFLSMFFLFLLALCFVVHSGKMHVLFCKLLFYIILDVNIAF